MSIPTKTQKARLQRLHNMDRGRYAHKYSRPETSWQDLPGALLRRVTCVKGKCGVGVGRIIEQAV